LSIQLRTTKTAAKSAGELRQLRELARLCGIATHYIDTEGRRKRPTPEGLLAITRALGVALDGMKNISTALDERRYVLWQQPMDPVAVAWEGKSPKIGVRVAAAKANSGVACELVLETGEVRRWSCDLHALQSTETAVVCGREFVVKQVPVQGQLPLGYHRFTVELRGQSAEALIISAPVRAFEAPSPHVPERKTWGVFLPLYALHSERSWGSGDFTDLEAFLRWTSELGGAAVATLPLLPAFLDDKPFDPSPYNPVSRFFWNEFYVDITRVPELRHCASAQALLGYAEIRSELAELRKARLVDY